MEELHKDIRLVRESQIRMEEDIKYHIKRTDLLEKTLEERLDPVYKAYIGLQWTVIIGSSAAGLVISVLKLMGKL